jgi:hypothetical protein
MSWPARSFSGRSKRGRWRAKQANRAASRAPRTRPRCILAIRKAPCSLVPHARCFWCCSYFAHLRSARLPARSRRVTRPVPESHPATGINSMNPAARHRASGSRWLRRAPHPRSAIGRRRRSPSPCICLAPRLPVFGTSRNHSSRRTRSLRRPVPPPRSSRSCGSSPPPPLPVCTFRRFGKERRPCSSQHARDGCWPWLWRL